MVLPAAQNVIHYNKPYIILLPRCCFLTREVYAYLQCSSLAYFPKMKVGLSNHQSVCLPPTKNF
jgi:hypothetical protein